MASSNAYEDTLQMPLSTNLSSFGFSEQELVQLTSLMGDFNPGQLANVIWDALQGVGFDDVRKGLGVFFESENSQCSPTVLYWDSIGAMKLPKKAFLQILELIAIHTLTNSSRQMGATQNELLQPRCEEGQAEIEAGRRRLILALKGLQEKIATFKEETSLNQRHFREGGFIDGEDEFAVLQQTQCRWEHGMEQSSPTFVRSRRGSLDSLKVRKGVESVLDGRPLPKTLIRKPLNERILAKIKALNVINAPQKGRSSRRASEPVRDKTLSTVSEETTLSTIEDEDDEVFVPQRHSIS